MKTYKPRIKNVLVMRILVIYFFRRTKINYKKRRIPICLFYKSCTQENVKCYTTTKVDLDKS